MTNTTKCEAPVHIANRIKYAFYCPLSYERYAHMSLTWKILLVTKMYFILVISATWKLHHSNHYCDIWYTPAARKSPSMTVFNCYDHISIRNVQSAQQQNYFCACFCHMFQPANSHLQIVHWLYNKYNILCHASN